MDRSIALFSFRNSAAIPSFQSKRSSGSFGEQERAWVPATTERTGNLLMSHISQLNRSSSLDPTKDYTEFQVLDTGRSVHRIET